LSELVFGRDQEVAAWVAQRMPTPVHFDKFAAIGVARGGKLIAGCVYTDFHQMPFGNDIRISFAADDPRWARKGIIGALLAYPMKQLGCVRVTTIIGRKNKRARRFNEGLGFILEGVCRRAYDGRQDACVYALYRDAALRWVEDLKDVVSRQAA
jgi:RimJ/RimL family protein N-acetyltransferase